MARSVFIDHDSGLGRLVPIATVREMDMDYGKLTAAMGHDGTGLAERSP